MDAQEFRSIQEAYMEVVENQLSNIGRSVKKSIHSASFGLSQEKPKDIASRTKGYSDKELDTISRGKDEPKPGKGRSRNAREFQLKVIEREKRRRQKANEETDIYDIILSHLLDEGYAETPEAAEAIMVNMSEEWRQSIIG